MKFSINDIPSIIKHNMVEKSVWDESCPVSIKRLKLLEVSHYNFEGKISNGQLITLDKVSKNVLNIFKELFIQKFPIHTIKLIDEFNGNDELSMTKNNSSCFNFRPIARSNVISMHSYGLAIDINPLQNPYIIINNKQSEINVFPKQSTEFLNRHNIRKGMVEPIVKIFKEHGFTEWGGSWNTPIDYHHFQVKRENISELI